MSEAISAMQAARKAFKGYQARRFRFEAPACFRHNESCANRDEHI